MKKLFTYFALIIFASVLTAAGVHAQTINSPIIGTALTGGGSINVVAGTQKTVMVKNALTATPDKNFTTFTTPLKNQSAEAIAANAKYATHPEANLLFPGTPCANCYELIGKRTETSKTFMKEGSSAKDGGKDVMVQTSTQPMHYRDDKGNWMTVKKQLQPGPAKGVYSATEQPVPVIINTAGADKYTSLGKAGENFRFNNNLELVYAKPDGSEVSLGKANWDNNTAGDEGMYVKDAWPGIDIEMRTAYGSIKTNFLIMHALPAYADGKLLVRDHMQLDKNLALTTTDGTQHTSGSLQVKNDAGEMKYVISHAVVYEKNSLEKTLRTLEYNLQHNNVLDIALPGSYLNKAAASYPVIIDPLVSQATSLTVNGSSYNALWTAGQGCLYTNPANTPVNSTVTDIQFSFEFTSTVDVRGVGFSFYLGTCRNPGTAAGGLSYTGMPAGATGAVSFAIGAYSLFSDLSPCLPPPSCASIPLNIQMYFYQNSGTTPACATTDAYGSQPLIITVFGHTVEVGGTGNATATPSTVCQGTPSTLSVSGTYGVPPYTIAWAPGALTGSPVTVTPTVTTTYTATITDACGITATAPVTLTVNPISPISGPSTVCTGSTIALHDATAGGAWSSATPGIATVNATSGAVTGVSPGLAVIDFTGPGGCVAAYNVIVITAAGPITGPTSLCDGNTIMLSDNINTGVWSSSNTNVATIDSNGGTLIGLSPGVTVIKYLNGGFCAATVNVTVNALPNITGVAKTDPTTCQGVDGTISLLGLAAATSYSVSYVFNGVPATVVVITSAGSGVLTIPGLAQGMYTDIMVVNAATLCISNMTSDSLYDPLPPPVPLASYNAPVCIGQRLKLVATDDVPGGSYYWSGPNGYYSYDQNPIIYDVPAAAAGDYTVIYSRLNCPTPGYLNVFLYPQVILSNITASQTIIYGNSIQLNADGALYYTWGPSDGSIDNPNINNPIATPTTTTTYEVFGTNIAGCRDTGYIVVTVDSNKAEIVPSAFTPNGDGLNDVFRITNMGYKKLVAFNVFNRWGQMVYHNSYDGSKGWDGTYNGVPQDAGVYNFNITVVNPDGVTKYYKGDVTLIR